MMSAAPLGALAEVILEQYGELIEAAIEDVLRRRTPRSPRDFAIAQEPQIHQFDSEELAQMQLQPGSWVTVGKVGDIQPRVLIDINLSTWEWREKAEPVNFADVPLGPLEEAAAYPQVSHQAAS
jgi:hypothetical protein